MASKSESTKKNQNQPDPNSNPDNRLGEEEATGDGASNTSTQSPPSNPSRLQNRRLHNRLLHRSSSDYELLSLPKTSETPMKCCLTWWDLIWLSFGSGIFTLIGQEVHNYASPSVTLVYAVIGSSALLSVFTYIEFSVDILVAGGSFFFLRIELGDLVAFLAAANILLEAIGAGLGRSWC